MKISASNKGLFETGADIYIVPVFKGLKKQFPSGIYGGLSAKINTLYNSGAIKDEYKKKTVYSPELKGQMKKILFLGLGEIEKLNFEKIREAAGFAIKEAKALGSKTAASAAFASDEKGFIAQVEGFLLADYVYDELKTGKKDEQMSTMVIASPGFSSKKVIDETSVVVEAVFFAKDLMNGPGNYTTPSKIAQSASASAKLSKKIKIKIFGLNEIKKMGMGAFYSVAKGSQEPAKFIVAEYKGAAASKKPVVFVGKGITFDSGGISLKPQTGSLSVIEDMKFDMSGAAAVLGLMRIIAIRKLPINAVFLAPAAENLPSGSAYKPGDVLTSLSGQTIEVISTDAEGRLLLCDALYYAQRYKPALIVDIATLTGACVFALGKYATGLMANENEFTEYMKKAGEDTGERVCQLPMLEEYSWSLKSKYADMKNIGSGGAGTIIAALFLQKFTGDYPWIHLDIAGTAYGIKDKSYIPDGVAATGVRLLYDFTKKILKGGLV
jgi:leucyl aminopeptidase